MRRKKSSRIILTFNRQKKMQIKQIKTEDLVQDGRNFNKGTAKGERLMTKSLRELGAGR